MSNELYQRAVEEFQIEVYPDGLYVVYRDDEVVGYCLYENSAWEMVGELATQLYSDRCRRIIDQGREL